ncbi:hypothetical protein Egran_05887 [Elaphomyces granulatus]|uniref:VPS9 domain-containing protein n=1 Tax=Elaphomyces granulatus TaxID=519963 RepID=A0A232LQA3_9EURO|nr:hypothetical protein Egran_05887 [Elaphomyces granulatus]
MSIAAPEADSRPPNGLHSTRSFTRMETSKESPFSGGRAKTIQPPSSSKITDPDTLPLSLSPERGDGDLGPDLFEKRDSTDSEGGDTSGQDAQPFICLRDVDDGSEELPIELVSLTDRFVESLNVRVHTFPPSIEKITGLFQEFYVRAESHIATHISTLALRINRDMPHNASGRPRPSLKDGTVGTGRVLADHQMLTASEVTERRKARKQLTYKRAALEEAVERRACERVYEKIWRHKSTLDEVRDEKLRSKTAALLVMGIVLKDLGVDIPTTVDAKKQEDADESLSHARESLMKMNDERYPLGKLHHLIAGHKAIVDTLTNLLPSSSSADEILPTLIYSLITCPPEGINAISNLLFIQRFRSASRVDGEAAYCLTNLEAAISFLEDVDLSSLGADELPDGQPKLLNNSVPASSTPRSDHLYPSKDTPVSSLASTTVSPEFSMPSISATLPKPQLAAPSIHQRRLSNLFQPPSKVFGAANDAVRNTADQGLKNISNTLDNSFNFLFGRLKEVQSNQRGGMDNQRTMLPKTLDEARRLVATPTILDEKNVTNEDGLVRGVEAPEQSSETSNTLRPEDRRGGRFDGRQSPRDRSVDSSRSNDSGRRQAATMRFGSQRDQITPSPSTSSFVFSTNPASTPLESMKNFGNTFNPLNHIPGMIRGFGRTAPETPTGASPTPIVSTAERQGKSLAPANGGSELATITKIDPPIKRFLELQDASDLKIGEIAELLEDYKRLATALMTLSR